MSEYIINPMWFYWLEIIDGFDFVVGILAAISGVGVIAYFISYMVKISNTIYKERNGWDSDYKSACDVMQATKIFIPLFIVFIILAIFIPDEETMLKMMIAKYTTYENAECTLDTIKSAVDYIVDAFIRIKG